MDDDDPIALMSQLSEQDRERIREQLLEHARRNPEPDDKRGNPLYQQGKRRVLPTGYAALYMDRGETLFDLVRQVEGILKKASKTRVIYCDIVCSEIQRAQAVENAGKFGRMALKRWKGREVIVGKVLVAASVTDDPRDPRFGRR